MSPEFEEITPQTIVRTPVCLLYVSPAFEDVKSHTTIGTLKAKAWSRNSANSNENKAGVQVMTTKQKSAPWTRLASGNGATERDGLVFDRTISRSVWRGCARHRVTGMAEPTFLDRSPFPTTEVKCNGATSCMVTVVT